jgi:hypothetical protein
MLDRSMHTIMLIAIFGLMLNLLALSAGAEPVQIKQGIERGAEATKKGAGTAVEKTKEGAKKTGDVVEDVFDDNDQDDQQKPADATREKPSEAKPAEDSEPTAAPDASKEQDAAEPSEPKDMTESESPQEDEDLPDTAGALPIYLFAGGLSLIAAGANRLIRKRRNG